MGEVPAKNAFSRIGGAVGAIGGAGDRQGGLVDGVVAKLRRVVVATESRPSPHE